MRRRRSRRRRSSLIVRILCHKFEPKFTWRHNPVKVFKYKRNLCIQLVLLGTLRYCEVLFGTVRYCEVL